MNWKSAIFASVDISSLVVAVLCVVLYHFWPGRITGGRIAFAGGDLARRQTSTPPPNSVRQTEPTNATVNEL